MSKNTDVVNMTKAQAAKAGLLDSAGADAHRRNTSKKLQGFTRQLLPPGIPDVPKFWIFSVSEYGEKIHLGAGFSDSWEVKPCESGDAYGPACPIKPIYFCEELEIDKTKMVPYTDIQIVDCIMKTGPGMTGNLNRALVGWFVSTSNPPSQEDIERATKIYLQECKRLFQEGNRFFQAGELKEINETHRRAKAVLNEAADWDKPQLAWIECPGCMERIREGAVFHPACGAVLNWEVAIERGMKKFEDAPLSVQEELTKAKKK